MDRSDNIHHIDAVAAQRQRHTCGQLQSKVDTTSSGWHADIIRFRSGVHLLDKEQAGYIHFGVIRSFHKHDGIGLW